MVFPVRAFLSFGEHPKMDADVVRLLQAFMTIDSTTGKEAELVDYVSGGLRSAGWHVRLQEVAKGRHNVYATRQPLEQHTPRLVFNSHFDTVPPNIPFTEDEIHVYGRGCTDAKGQMACMIIAANRLVKEFPEIAKDVALLFVVGEELDHIGMIKANELPHYDPSFLIVGEPTEMKFGSIQKGALKVHINCSGKAGHSGYATSGHSATHDLIQILHDITTYKWPQDDRLGDTTYNVGLIQGGQALNAWAGKASASVFFRVTTSYADIKEKIIQIVGDRATLDFSLGGNDPVKLTLPPYNAPLTQVSFNTDLPYYNKVHLLKGAFLFGAGSITVAHGPDEFCPKRELYACVDEHVKLASQLLKEQ